MTGVYLPNNNSTLQSIKEINIYQTRFLVTMNDNVRTINLHSFNCI